MTEPLTSSEIDLRDFPYMPLDVVRLRDSETAVLTSGEGFRAAVLLWCAAWHQVPAASLPDDDRILANLAGFGRFVDEWRKVREDALRGFIICSDGRLYHATIAEKATEAWEARKSHRERLEKARQAKAAKASVAASMIGVGIEPLTGCEEGPSKDLKGREGKGREIIEHQDSGSSHDMSDAQEAAHRKAKRAKPKTQISEDAQPTERDRKAAEDAGLGLELFRSEWRAFRDHHRAKGSLMADWSAAWRTWLGRMPQYQPSRAGPVQMGAQKGGFAISAMEHIENARQSENSEGRALRDVPQLSFDGGRLEDAGGWHDGGVSGGFGKRSIGGGF